MSELSDSKWKWKWTYNPSSNSNLGVFGFVCVALGHVDFRAFCALCVFEMIVMVICWNYIYGV